MDNWKRTFFVIWGGQAFSLIGSQMIHFAIAWWLTQETGSAAALATMAIFYMLPEVILGPFIGALVDRWNRQRVMIVSDGLIALVTLLLAVLFMLGLAQIWFLYVTALIRGTLGVFHWTAMQASTSLIVPKDQLQRVAGMNQTLRAVLSIAAPPLGALLVGLLPLYGIMFIDVGTALIAILPLLFVHIPQPDKVSSALITPISVLRDVRDGLRYVARWPGLLMVLGMATLVNFILAPSGVLTPLLVTRYFEGGVWHLSAIESSWSIGAIVGGLLLSTWGGFRKRIATSMTFLVLLGIAHFAIGIIPPWLFWLAIGFNAVSGLTNPLVNGPLFAILQSSIAPEMQGRVFTLAGSLAGMMAPLGMALAAPIADRLGVQVWWQIGGVVTLLMGLSALMTSAIMNIEEDMTRKPDLSPSEAAHPEMIQAD